MALQIEKEYFLKDQLKIKKKQEVSAAPKPPSMTSKLLTKMMKEIKDETLIDYS